MTRALAVVSNSGYQTTCTIHLAAGTYPTPNGTLFNGTPYGTHTGPVVISGATNSTSAWCDTIASVPTIASYSFWPAKSGGSPAKYASAVLIPIPLYTFETISNIPVLWNTNFGSINYFGGFTFTPTFGHDNGTSYMVAFNSTFLSSNQLYIAYDAAVGTAPQFTIGDTFCLYGPPLAILAGSTDNALWQSTNGFAHTLQNVQVQAYSAGTGLLQWQGMNWALQNVWLTGQYNTGKAGITVTASNSALSAGVTTGSRQGLFLGLLPTTAFTCVASQVAGYRGTSVADYQQSALVLGTNSTATLQNSVFRSGAVQALTSTSTASLTASMFWAYSALLANTSGATVAVTNSYSQVRFDATTLYIFQANASNGGVITMQSVAVLSRVVAPAQSLQQGFTVSGSSTSSLTLDNSTFYSGYYDSTFKPTGIIVTAGSMLATNGSLLATMPFWVTGSSAGCAQATGNTSLITISGSTLYGGTGAGTTVAAAGGASVNFTAGSTGLCCTTNSLLVASGSGSTIYLNGGSSITTYDISCANLVEMDNEGLGVFSNTTVLGGTDPAVLMVSTSNATFAHTNPGVVPMRVSMLGPNYASELTGTNLGNSGSAPVVHICGTLKSWSQIDAAGSGGIVIGSCTFVAN